MKQVYCIVVQYQAFLQYIYIYMKFAASYTFIPLIYMHLNKDNNFFIFSFKKLYMLLKSNNSEFIWLKDHTKALAYEYENLVHNQHQFQ